MTYPSSCGLIKANTVRRTLCKAANRKGPIHGLIRASINDLLSLKIKFINSLDICYKKWQSLSLDYLM